MRPSFWFFLPFFALTGCYTYSTVDVRAVDAATHQPVPGLRIDVDYRRFMEFFPPRLDSAVTNADGTASLTVCTDYHGGGPVDFVIDGDWHLLDKPTPTTVATYRADDFQPPTKTPYHVELNLLTISEQRARYP